MNRERNKILMLLDLCAFAYSQDHGRNSRQDLEAACGLAERYSLPEAKMYRDLLCRLGQDLPSKGGLEVDARTRRFQDEALPPL